MPSSRVRALGLVEGTRFEPAGAREVSDEVVVEEPLEIRIAGDALAMTMRTPGHDEELAAGFLLAEGLVTTRSDVGSIAHCGRPDEEGYGNVIDVVPAAGTSIDLERAQSARRGTLVTAACGVCGRRSVDDLMERVRPVSDAARFDREVVAKLTERLRENQPAFERSGGLHAAGVATAAGEWRCTREDVGRHNAVDKVIGHLFAAGELPATGHALVVSGRTSFEIVQKAVVAGFPLVVSVSAPTSLAVSTARRARVTLAAFARSGVFTVYSAVERIAG